MSKQIPTHESLMNDINTAIANLKKDPTFYDKSYGPSLKDLHEHTEMLNKLKDDFNTFEFADPFETFSSLINIMTPHFIGLSDMKYWLVTKPRNMNEIREELQMEGDRIAKEYLSSKENKNE